MAEGGVQEQQQNSGCATRVHVQKMETGLVGARGQLAPKPVNPGLKLDQGAARRLNMAENHVQERHENSACATRIYVQSMVVGLTGATGRNVV